MIPQSSEYSGHDDGRYTTNTLNPKPTNAAQVNLTMCLQAFHPIYPPLRTLSSQPFWDFDKLKVPYLGVLIIRILLFTVLY